MEFTVTALMHDREHVFNLCPETLVKMNFLLLRDYGVRNRRNGAGNFEYLPS